ncbi:hypothetical protein CDJ58_07065 [Campylobacter lari]|uniref:Uncharacterized protein n=1 Tax=Campylobacter peloridis TaxID=488546 RepID=A0A5C7DZW2_9BACT|nr:hypothetical protein [Campylobacter peloridis]EAH8851390.1 hypothetical protein [Campylobacter lari]EAK5749149.1 hypothetical protein [Campylobacter lari]EAK9878344.1 hypothetical protein [Campylobacter lari]TXE84190.1 hypothetical protein FPD46_01365 [Campylobacter peloridis]
MLGILNNETSSNLTNLVLELNTAIRKVQILQQQIGEVHNFIQENGLEKHFLDIAKQNNLSFVLNYSDFAKLSTQKTENNCIQKKVLI